MPVPVALSSAEAEYMSCCNLGAMICHLRELLYEFAFLGTSEYKMDGEHDDDDDISRDYDNGAQSMIEKILVDFQCDG